MDFHRLLVTCSKRIHTPAFRFPDRDVSITYRELLDLSGVYCGLYRRLGLVPGDRVALWMGSVPEYVLAFTAALRMGLVAVPLSVYEQWDKVCSVCDACGCALMLYDGNNRYIRATLEKADALPANWLDVSSFASDNAIRLPPDEAAADCAWDWDLEDTYCILHSSGSTGERKSIRMTVVSTFGKKSAMRGMRLMFYLLRKLVPPFDRFISSPFYHAAGNYMLMLVLSGCYFKLVAQEYFNPVHTARYLAQEQPTAWMGTATMFYRICCANPAGSLVYPMVITASGEAVSDNMLRTFSEQEGCQLLLSYYGTTELGRISSLICPIGRTTLRTRISCFLSDLLDFGGMAEKPGKRTDHSKELGKISKTVEIDVRGEDGRSLPDGEVGEIFGRKAGSRRVYLDQERPEEWISTGDVGYRRGRRLYLLGRKKELIIRSGENIIPSEIEEQLLKCPGVEDAVVFGVPSPDHGEDVCACIQTAGAPDLEAIQAHLRDSLPRFMLPQHYLFREDFPYNATGKTDRKRIAAESRASLGL